MEARYPLAGGSGWLSVREEGARAICEAELPDDGRGLYKAYLVGTERRLSLGALLPEGGALRLRRTLNLSELHKNGVWPPVGGGVELSYSAGWCQPRTPTPTGWVREQNPKGYMGDRMLARAAGAAGECLLRREGDRLTLAFPWRADAPFPMVPLVCFSALQQVGGAWYALFHFNSRGCPVFSHKEGGNGDANGVTTVKE